jgi:hypothetical protein
MPSQVSTFIAVPFPEEEDRSPSAGVWSPWGTPHCTVMVTIADDEVPVELVAS